MKLTSSTGSPDASAAHLIAKITGSGPGKAVDIWMCPTCRQPLAAHAESFRCAHCGFALENHAGIWTSDPGFTPDGFSRASRTHLHELEAQHFWFKPRAQLFERILRKRFAPPV